MNTNQKGFSSTSLLIVGVLVLILGGVLYTVQSEKKAPEATPADAMMEKDDSVEHMQDTMMSEEENASDLMENINDHMMSTYQGSVLAGTVSPLIDFNKVDYEAALASGKPVFLYFYANWCPTCKAEQPILIEAFDRLEQEGVVGFRVNYKDDQTDNDEETLAKQYGVAYQHTKVVIVGGDAVALKSPESWDAARYKKELGALTQ